MVQGSPMRSIVVRFCGLHLESYEVIPKRSLWVEFRVS